MNKMSEYLDLSRQLWNLVWVSSTEANEKTEAEVERFKAIVSDYVKVGDLESFEKATRVSGNVIRDRPSTDLDLDDDEDEDAKDEGMAYDAELRDYGYGVIPQVFLIGRKREVMRKLFGVCRRLTLHDK